jgi:hypothetical protein
LQKVLERFLLRPSTVDQATNGTNQAINSSNSSENVNTVQAVNPVFNQNDESIETKIKYHMPEVVPSAPSIENVEISKLTSGNTSINIEIQTVDEKNEQRLQLESKNICKLFLI